MEINGVIARIQFYNPTNGYTVAVFELTPEDFQKLAKQKHFIGNRITVVGVFDRQVVVDEEYSLIGDLVVNQTYGLQFKFSSFTRKEWHSEDGIINYLSSDIFPGIGAITSKRIVDALGNKAIEEIIKDKEVLLRLGISKKNADIIYQVLKDNEINQKIILFFMNYGITLETCHKIVATLGANAIERVKENPYILMERIQRFGFKRNDAFALRLGEKPDSLKRLRAVIMYVLKEWIFNSGNSFLERPTLIRLVSKYIETEIDGKQFDKVFKDLINDNLIHYTKEGFIFDATLYHQEIELAKEIVKRIKNEKETIESYSMEKVEKLFNEISEVEKMEFDEHQKIAIQAAFSEPIVIITGGPGTGKTTIIRTIIEMYLKLHHDNSTMVEEIALLAPTGRAAKRLKEVTSIQAQTIHKFLGFQGENIFLHNRENPTHERLIIVDEASMMDLPLAYHLVTSMDEKSRLIIVGDVDQLPSVGPGQVLKDLIDTKEIKTIRLHQIHRQAKDSHIIKFAHELNEGILSENILEKFPDRLFFKADLGQLVPGIISLVQNIIGKDEFDIKKNVQILAPMYKGEVGINELNERLQALVNPNAETGEIKHGGQVFRIDDKVIQLVNRSDKNIMNGDIGIVNHFLYKNGVISGLNVFFDSGGVDYTIEELEDLKLAYAISIHKAQGSEFDLVILPISSKHFYMLKRKLIYTAVTRAKKILILIGNVSTLANGIKRIEQNRLTILKNKILEFITSGLPKIDDSASAFETLGEREFGNFNPYDFE